MAQFDVFSNPIGAARAAYPFVVAMQSDFAWDNRDLVVAPLVPRSSLGKIAGRLTPIVAIDESEHVVLVNGLTTVRTRDLIRRHCSIVSARSELLNAIDYLFFGA
jgi:toxin CcdB